MNYTMMTTHFMGTCQDLALDKRGNKYGVSMSKGGYRYAEDPEFEGEEWAGACSPDFDDYDTAIAFYTRLVNFFGKGFYKWEDRANIVRKGVL